MARINPSLLPVDRAPDLLTARSGAGDIDLGFNCGLHAPFARLAITARWKMIASSHGFKVDQGSHVGPAALPS